MKRQSTTLVMAGAREAHGLVTGLLARGRRVIASLPEPERMFEDLPVPTRVGPFGGTDAVMEWLQGQEVGAVFDASHAFDHEICAKVRAAAERLDLRYLRILRPPWQATPRDRWLDAPTLKDVVQAVPEGARVFSNTGWPSLPDYDSFRGAALFMRQTGSVPRPLPFPFVRFIEGQPPFSQFQEETLFRDLGVTHLICRNVGGAASMSKLLAARALSIPVFMVRRADLPPLCPVVETVAEALAWEAGF